ncbi:protein FAR1-RELATED SEQUENCE 5-like [Olea europaea var. sylvestris]|uniref:protein FAR1-RELATED SEQUENCE 5-like n=1 Tax=Olea europaea var. sylvestris TaxID=158386 RepID=UPI000C1D2B9F|nr:protein FAR1-RELATED SEQUENCE 5-like [Olea europaea var. sylvestris]
MESGNENGFMESDNEIVSDNINVADNDTLRGDGEIVPEVGMTFKDEKELFDFYKQYAYSIGFPVRKRNSKKGDDGTVRFVTFTCSREGRRSSNTNSALRPQPTSQTDCKARISASADCNGTWRINTVNLQHNHKTSPSKSRLFRCNRELSANVKRKLEMNDIAGIPLHKSFNSAVVEAGGYDNMTCIEKDCRNYIEQVRRLRLGEGDATALQSYFSQMQARCSGFYFAMDLDDESRLKNEFWADNRCRQAYKEFGDVVTFDTTYLTNKYDMPFAPFVGVNHHGQSTLLGCGLLSNENTSTFVWLFRTWLQCMHDQPPCAIITDQDKAMQNAIEIVFPNTRHRWCLWHIMKKLPEKFGYHIDKSSIFSTIHRLVYDSQVVDEFEKGWRAMIDEFELHDNDWLFGLYENRGRWVPCFLKTTFWAGMSTTQRSESINAFFDGYVHSKTSLKQFVEQYERALRNKVEKEFQADFKSYSQMVPCATSFEMEKQFQLVYTISKFKEVQDEFVGKIYCDVASEVEGLDGVKYEVRESVVYLEGRKKKTFLVSFRRETSEVMCSCHLFEFRGIVCRHAITVLDRNDLTRMPEKYILRRWRRDVGRAHTRVAVNYAGLVSTPEQLRYDDMCQAFSEVADLAANDEGRARAIMDWIKCQATELRTSRSSGGSNVLPQQNFQGATQCIGSQNTTGVSVLNPNLSNRKGAPKKLRKKGPLESISKKASSKSDKGKRLRDRRTDMEETAPEVQQSQQLQHSQPTPFSYSQLLLGDFESQVCTQPSVASPNVVFNSQGASFANSHLPHPEVAVTGTSQMAYNYVQVQGSDSFLIATHLPNLSNVLPITHPRRSFHNDARISDDK